MTEKKFPDEKTMQFFEKALREIIEDTQQHAEVISSLCDRGDLQIFCQLLAATFIYGVRDYIESVRRVNNDSNENAFNCYLACVEILRRTVTDEMVVDVFKCPPEDWVENTVKV